MGSVEMTCLDLECGGGSSSSAVNNDGNDENICFSKADEDSCYFQSNLVADSSNHGHNSDSEVGKVLHARGVSSVVGTDCAVDIENSVDEVRISLGTMKRECRICMLSLDLESGVAIELGCSCKNELGAVHQHCAQQWFKSKGNRVCEICKSIAQNVVPHDIKSRQQSFEVNRFLTNAVSMPVFERNMFSTNAVSLPVLGSQTFVPVYERHTSSTNAVSGPVSSTLATSVNRVYLKCERCIRYTFCVFVLLICILVMLNII